MQGPTAVIFEPSAQTFRCGWLPRYLRQGSPDQAGWAHIDRTPV